MDRAEGVEFYRQKTSRELLLFFKDKAKYKKGDTHTHEKQRRFLLI